VLSFDQLGLGRKVITFDRHACGLARRPSRPVDNDGKTASGEEGAAGSGAMSESSSGCSATGSGASGSTLLMVLAVLGLAIRRRSARA
jgi:uncharacterized protein (TIGR03382 family)